MAHLDRQQRLAFERRVDKMKEDGFFLPTKRSLSGDTRYLIISYGGTGADALFGVKRLFETVLPADQIEERIRYLAIDTDKATQKLTRERKKPDGTKEIEEVDSLLPKQFCQLQGNAARHILTGKLDTQIVQWINPQLVQKIRDDNQYLTGDGASGTRQVGRVTLYPSSTYKDLENRILGLARELTDGNRHPLRVFILTGIAGGTGSGTVVDLTYLIRYLIGTQPFADHTRYCGFVLLPPTGKSKDTIMIEHGDHNGYAALKEINHFMTLRLRGEKYRFAYENGVTAECSDNIFDTCYLMDGIQDGVQFSNAREQVIKVLGESLLDMITASQIQPNDGGAIQAVDSFMNDVGMFTTEMVSGKSINQAMRDADYLYCALGHNEFAIPANEIKAYVGKKLFDEIYALFLRCNNANEEAAKAFLHEIIDAGVKTDAAIRRKMNEKIDKIFMTPRGGQGGPYYVVNLLKLVADDAVQKEKLKPRLLRHGMVSDQVLDWIKDHAIRVNNETFDTYTLAMDTLRDMFADQFGSVVKTEHDKYVYSFMPISLGKAEESQFVIQYLDDLINKDNLNLLVKALLQELLENRDEWTALTNSDVTMNAVAPAAMRKFWNAKLDEIVGATMEDFLIKFYSGDAGAYYDPANDGATRPYLNTAAVAIYKEMLGAGGKAQPMVDLTPKGLTANDFNGHIYLMVPGCAPHLMEELKAYAATQDRRVVVCTSMASDRISCYKQYTSIPAFKLKWVQQAEKAYEKALATTTGIGLHMSETVGGMQWKNFPSLLPESTWDILLNDYTNPREAVLAKKAETLFADARALGLAVSHLPAAGAQNLYYRVRILPEAYRPADALFRELDSYREDSADRKRKLEDIAEAAKGCASELFKKISGCGSTDPDVVYPALEQKEVVCELRNLYSSMTVMTKATHDDKPDWNEYIAACMLRKLPNTMHELDGTIMVMRELVAMLEKSQRNKKLVKKFAQYLATGMFRYDADSYEWSCRDGDGLVHILATMKNVVERKASYYFLFNAFRAKADQVADMLVDAFEDRVPYGDLPGAELRAREDAFAAGGEKLKSELVQWLNEDPLDDYEDIAEDLGQNVQAIRNFYGALHKEAKQIATGAYIPVAMGTKTAKKKKAVVQEPKKKPVVDPYDF